MPGAGKQSLEVQAQIKELLEAGFDPTTIHRRLKVGRSSIYRMKRSLQQHGTAYMPPELSKKNGRPKALSPDQELEVRNWLAAPENRTRFLDDLVWLIHDRFGLVCSTTTMSKLKRKWLSVIEAEETGKPLDEHAQALLLESHPHHPLLMQQFDHHRLAHADENLDPQVFDDDRGPPIDASHPYGPLPVTSSGETVAALTMQQRAQAADAQIDARLTETQHDLHDQAIDEQLKQQLRREIARPEMAATERLHV